MSLNKLKFSAEVRPNGKADALTMARTSLLSHLDTQRVLLNAERTGTPANLTRGEKAADGSVTIKRIRPRQWFWKNASGEWLFQVLHGHKPLPLTNDGKATIVAGKSLDDVEKIIGIVVEATQKGELDAMLMASREARSQKAKKTVA